MSWTQGVDGLITEKKAARKRRAEERKQKNELTVEGIAEQEVADPEADGGEGVEEEVEEQIYIIPEEIPSAQEVVI